MDLCRACLTSDKDLFQSDDSFVCNYNLLTNLDVKPFDGKSQKFCQTCMEAVSFFIDFRSKCVSAESTLQDIAVDQIKSETLTDLGLPIKGEIKNENDDSFDAPYEDAKPEYDDQDYFIKAEESFDVPIKQRKKLGKKKFSLSNSCHKKLTKDALTFDGNFIKLSNEKPVCGLCGNIFHKADELNRHLEGHRTDRNCQICSMGNFEHWSQILAHRVVHTVNHQSCHLCRVKFRSHVYLEYHYRKIHDGEKDIQMKCSHCSRNYSSPRKLTKHLWAIHSRKEFICDICSKVFHSKQGLKCHLTGHTDVRRYVCYLCGYSSKYATGLAAHNVRRHSPKKCICKECNRVFADPDKMAKHACLDKSKICPVCGKHLRHGFSRHMASHVEERRYKCERCPATYRSRTALKVHCDKHDNNPTQQCEHCHARFYSPSVLIKHRRVHTGEKPYACNKCDMRFTGRHNLKVHMKVHGEMLIVKRNTEPTV